MKRIALIVFFMAGWAMDVVAQDPQFSQYYAQPIYLNPGFTGTADKHRVILNNRIQWPSLPRAFVTNALSWDLNVESVNSGFGLLAVSDKAGQVGLNNTTVGLLYAYKLYIANRFVLSSGLKFAYAVRNMDFSKLLTYDQIEFGGGSGSPSIDPTLQTLQSSDYFDFDFGMLLYDEIMWFGAAVSHLNEPNSSFVEDNYRLPRKYTVHGGVRLPLNQGVFASDRPTHFAASFIFKKQEEFDQLDIGVSYYYQPINMGIWYRGVPIQKYTNEVVGTSYRSHDALIFLIGFAAWDFQFDYSYDFNISQMSVDGGGAHEFSMSYRFKIGRFRPLKVKHKPIPCPTFYDHGLYPTQPLFRSRDRRKQ